MAKFVWKPKVPSRRLRSASEVARIGGGPVNGEKGELTAPML